MAIESWYAIVVRQLLRVGLGVVRKASAVGMSCYIDMLVGLGSGERVFRASVAQSRTRRGA